MKKLIFLLLAIQLTFILLFVACPTPTDTSDTGSTDTGDTNDSEILGAYLKITTQGNYLNEITGLDSSEQATLNTYINLYPESNGKGTKGPGGFFGGGGNSGITFSASTGFGLVTTGSAHVNGFITKGPFNEGSPVEISIVDENFNEIDIDPQFITQLQDQTGNTSEFSITLSATEDVEIPININLLTTLQSARLNSLTSSGMSYGEAYDKAKAEVLNVFNFGNIENVDNFENMDIDGSGNNDSLLVIASSVVLNNNTGGTKGINDFINGVTNDIAENGAVTNELLSDTITENMLNTDFDNVINNLNNYLSSTGQSGSVPPTDDYEDSDGDGLVDLYELELISPIGLTTNNTADFDWEDSTVNGAEYLLQYSYNQDFIDSQTTTITGLTVSEYAAWESFLFPTYYWRVAVVDNGSQKQWSTTSSFTITSDTSQEPYGSMILLGNLNATSSRAVTINTSCIIGATEMRFSNDGIFDTPAEDWTQFELNKRWMLTPNEGEKTIYAEFSNNNGISSMSMTIPYIVNTSTPSGSFTINAGATSTNNANVILNMDGISGAFKMRLSNTGTFTDEPWINFSTEYPWTLSSGEGTKTVKAQFKNYMGIYDTEQSISLDSALAPSGTFAINEGDQYTTSSDVVLNLINISGADYMYFSNSEATPTDADYFAYARTYPFQLEPEPGIKEIYGYFKNENGDTYSTTDTIEFISPIILDFGDIFDGTVIMDPDLPHYEYGTEVTLIPQPDSGYIFMDWGGDHGSDVIDNGDGTFHIIMNETKYISVNFIPASTLDITIIGNGMVDVEMSAPPIKSRIDRGEIYTVPAGSELTLTPTPDNGNEFSLWSGTDSSYIMDMYDGTYTIMMDTDMSITAEFAQQYRLDLTIEGNGTVDSSPVIDSGNPYFSNGSVVELYPNPDTESSFYAWEGDNTGDIIDLGDGYYEIIMDSDKSITAKFILDSYDLPLVGQISTTNAATDVVYRNGYAYVADDQGGLRIIDVSTPSSPTEVGYYDTSTYAYSVALSGDYAYISDAFGGYVIVNISDPTSPTLAGTFSSTYASNSFIDGNYAYLADETNGLVIIDVSNPTSPTQVGHLASSGASRGVYVVGNYAYIADDSNGLVIADISTPTSPTQVGHYDTDGISLRVHVSDNYAYVADSANGLVIIDVSNPASPTQAGHYDTMGDARGIFVLDNYIYVADESGGLLVFDNLYIDYPMLLSEYLTTGTARGICVAEGLAYLTDRTDGLMILDVSVLP